MDGSGARPVIIFGGARDYHAMHWFRTLRTVSPTRPVFFLTDLIAGEGFEKMAKDDDDVHRLIVIDRLLFSRITHVGDIWRNIVKLAVLPLQALLLRRFVDKRPGAIVHAHPMYYMLVCLLAGVDYVGRPQGSEILVRSSRSVYRYFATKALRRASYVTVDSEAMRRRIAEISGVEAVLVPNGIDVEAILAVPEPTERTNDVLSLRGLAPLYRIEEIVRARGRSRSSPALRFIFPFANDDYRGRVEALCDERDRLLGRLEKAEMYAVLKSTKLAVSIPSTDSSPRTVYEALFAGCCVAVSDGSWIATLPEVLRRRLFIIDFSSSAWLDEAVAYAETVNAEPFVVTEILRDAFDEQRTIARAAELLYG